ncbi:MAG: cytidylate kinase-like family protein [Thermodesulfobacteriota bacterium]
MDSENSPKEEFPGKQSRELIDQLLAKVKAKNSPLPVITMCIQPGSGGHMIAAEVAHRLGVELYDKNMLVPMANAVDAESQALEAIEQERPSGIQDFISSLLKKNYVYTGDYLQYLKDTVEIIGKINNGVIVGRGANFILPYKGQFSVRTMAPLDIRVKNVAFRFGVSLDEAKKRVKNREQKRKNFVKEAFRKDITDPEHYDLIINTARMGLEASVDAIIGAALGGQTEGVFEKENSYILRNRK